jgi:putative oxygen-independent coproporphyrinogen III oxidase
MIAAPLMRAPRFRTLPPLSLYIHVPWCVRKCPYCDFNSHEARGEIPESTYVAALVADLDLALPLIWGRRVYTIFFGGGTPSLMSAETIDAILSAVRARVPLATDAEITLEANPGTFESERFAAYRAAGVNRLSIGIQSFNERHLQALGRIHDADQAHRAIEIAREHFESFNLDLMYALPGQTPAEARADIDAAIAYEPPHLSVYHLTIEPNTFFYRHPPQVPDDDTAAEMEDLIGSALRDAAYEHYETSAYARAGHRARHNLNYWTFGDYLGIGAGAHSKLTFPDRVVRQARYRQPREYMDRAIAGDAVQTDQALESGDIAFEFMMNALRLNDGFASALFEERTGLPLLMVLSALDEAEHRGFMERDHQHMRPTALGQRFLNDLLQIFMPAAPARVRAPAEPAASRRTEY